MLHSYELIKFKLLPSTTFDDVPRVCVCPGTFNLTIKESSSSEQKEMRHWIQTKSANIMVPPSLLVKFKLKMSLTWEAEHWRVVSQVIIVICVGVLGRRTYWTESRVYGLQKLNASSLRCIAYLVIGHSCMWRLWFEYVSGMCLR